MTMLLASPPSIHMPLHLARMVASGHQLTVADMKTLDVPEFGKDELVALWLDSGDLLAVTRSVAGHAAPPGRMS